MVVADNHVYAFGLGIIHFFIGLDAAVEGNDKGETVLSRPVYSFI